MLGDGSVDDLAVDIGQLFYREHLTQECFPAEIDLCKWCANEARDY